MPEDLTNTDPDHIRDFVGGQVQRQQELARRSMVPTMERQAVTEDGQVTTLTVTREGVGPIESEYGTFQLFSFKVDDRWDKYSVLIKGHVDDEFQPHFQQEDGLLIRVDSGCETGQLFHDRTCECREQLLESMTTIEKRGEGIVVNVPRQDGRGMGLPFKLATLRLQRELKLNTILASAMLEPDKARDVRTYGGVIAILQFLGIRPPQRLAVTTNNPKKLSIFLENGFTVDMLPIVIPPTEHTHLHLVAKQEHLGHINLVGHDAEEVVDDRL